MIPVVEKSGLSKADADRLAEDLSLDAETVEIIAQPDGSFTVRATYAEGTIIPGATLEADSQAPFALTGLNRATADEEAAFFRDSGATVVVEPQPGDLFTIRVAPTPKAVELPKPPTATVAPPDMDGYVFCVNRIRAERRPGVAFDRTVSNYQAFFNRTPVANISGMAVERQGPGDNSPSGVANERRIAAGTYPLFTHDGASNERYKTFGYAKPANISHRPWPSIRVGDTGSRTGILIHCAAGYLMSTGCINLAASVANAGSNLIYADSWARVVALIESIRSHLGADFPNANNKRLPNTFLVVRDF